MDNYSWGASAPELFLVKYNMITVHEGFKLGNKQPITIEDKYEDIKRNLSHFIGDKICVQGINNSEQAELYEGTLLEFFEIQRKQYQNPNANKDNVLAMSVDTDLFGEEIFKFGRNMFNEERIGRIIVERHLGKVNPSAVGKEIYESHETDTDIKNGNYFENPIVLEKWYTLLRRGRTTFNRDTYDFFVKAYNLFEPLKLESSTKIRE